MTAIQKMIAASTLAFLAVFFHVLFCEWETGQTYGGPERAERISRVIIPMGADIGIHARSSATHSVDAILGVALPVTLIATGIFVLVGPKKNPPYQDNQIEVTPR
jgi:hypothetical protein